jgi:DNA-binding HxlR family transcriptional regulator
VVKTLPKELRTPYVAQQQRKITNRLKLIALIGASKKGVRFSELAHMAHLSEKVLSAHLSEMQKHKLVRKAFDESESSVRYVTTGEVDKYVAQNMPLLSTSVEETLDIICRLYSVVKKNLGMTETDSFGTGWAGHYVGVFRKENERLIVIRSPSKSEINRIKTFVNRRRDSDEIHYYEPEFNELYVNFRRSRPK